jgi:UDP-glucose:(heptosyl)LPS alpha-1,3-glucosyltransferase
MACAMPIVTSTRSGAAELALEHDAGLVCAPGDVGRLAAHMRTLQDRTVRARLGEHARRAVLPLTSAAMTERLIALYRDLLDRELYFSVPPLATP